MQVIARSAAADQGLSFYYTGKACKHGHVSRRRTKDGNCVECTRVKATKRYYSDPDRHRAAARRRYQEDPEKFKRRSKEYNAANPDAVRENRRSYRARNRESTLARHARYVKERKQKDPVFAIALRMRSMIGNCLRVRGFKKTSKTAEILGCSWEFFAAHIERQFLKGMSWENMGEWHIDHIIPMATATTTEEAIALNHVSNLRPMWGPENLSKNAKVQFLI